MKFQLFSDIYFTKGYLRSVINDSNRNDYHFISTEFYEESKQENKSEEFINFCLEHEFGFNCPEELTENFSPLELLWEMPNYISNCVIECENFQKLDFIHKIEALGCQDFSLIFHKLSIEEFKIFMEQHLEFFDRSKSIELLFTYTEGIDVYIEKNFEKLFEKSKIKTVTILNAPIDKIIHEPVSGYYFVHMVAQEIKNIFNPENHSWQYMTCNIDFLAESQKYHTYFNRKLYIGINGEIKNAPECEEVHGNIYEIKNHNELLKIIESRVFQKYWNVRKDLCDVCKDCELRYMCLDNRLPYQRNKNEWFHKTECNYNPYISKWKDEEGYKTLEECGVISNQKTFSINHQKMEELIAELWEESDPMVVG